MTDLWYYAEDEKASGPLHIDELVPLLVRIADPQRIMIWRYGFDDWRPLEDVREVAQHIFQPPPIKSRQPKLLSAPVALVREPAVDAEDAAYFKNVEPGPVGLGGWLILVGIGQIVGNLRFLTSMGEYYGKMDERLFAKFPAVMWGEAAMNGAFFLLFLYTTILFFQKSRNFPKFFILQFIAAFLLPIASLIWAAVMIASVTGKPTSEFLSMDSKDGAQLVSILIGAVIWIPYIRKSRRVANTFI